MRLSSVLHMGDRGLYGSRVVFCWNHKIFWRSWCAVFGLPCAVRWVYAHGSKTEATSDIAFPHDSAVSADAECARVCNTHTWDTRASVRASASWESACAPPPAHAGTSRRTPLSARGACTAPAHAGIGDLDLAAAPREPPHRITPPDTLTLSQMS